MFRQTVVPFIGSHINNITTEYHLSQRASVILSKIPFYNNYNTHSINILETNFVPCIMLGTSYG